MSTPHIGAERGVIAETVLLPGDPRRAEWIAKNFLTDCTQYNTVRNMSGFTGNYAGRRVSVHGTGIGMPTLSIVVNELIKDFGVNCLIRVGSSGSFQPYVKLRDVIIAQGACSDSAMNTRRFPNAHFAPLADFDLLLKAYAAAKSLSIPVRVGNILATDMFYDFEEPDMWMHWAKYGVLVAEMETAELYTLASYYGVRALTILMVSDSLVTKEHLSPLDREQTFTDMIKIALQLT